MSSQVHLSTVGSPWKRLFDANLTQSTDGFVSGGLKSRPFASAFVPDTIPVGPLAVIDLRAECGPGGPVPNFIMFRFFGTDTSNQTFSARLWGIARGQGRVGAAVIDCWMTQFIAEVLATLSATASGGTSTLIAAADLEADTIALTNGASQDIVINNSPSDVNGASVSIDIRGFDQLAVELDAASSAVTANALYRFIH